MAVATETETESSSVVIASFRLDSHKLPPPRPPPVVVVVDTPSLRSLPNPPLPSSFFRASLVKKWESDGTGFFFLGQLCSLGEGRGGEGWEGDHEKALTQWSLSLLNLRQMAFSLNLHLANVFLCIFGSWKTVFCISSF